MSEHGGTRKGAGRPKGAKNKKTQQQEELVKKTGMTPLEYLTRIYQDELQEERTRIDAAKAAAPYVHAKLSQVDMNANVDVNSHEEMLDKLK